MIRSSPVDERNISKVPMQADLPIFVENATIIRRVVHAADQYLIALHAPRCAHGARPGMFVHVQCTAFLPMRRPLSILRADPQSDTIELLFRAVGTGTRALSERTVGETVSIIGPIGQSFEPDRQTPRVLLLGGGIGIPPIIYFAESLQKDSFAWQPLVFMGSEVPVPFTTRISSSSIEGVDPRVNCVIQVSLEEFMACGVGGWAGCTVPVPTANGRQMKRVCVDGPVFPTAAVFPDFF